MLIAARDVFKNHGFWPNFRRKIRTILTINLENLKLETQN